MRDVPGSTKFIKRIDKSNMFGLLMDFPGQFKDAARRGRAIDIPKVRGIDNIVFSGLGGSAIGADLLRSYIADEIELPVFVNRHYALPRFVGRKTLFVASSYSGNTEETLESYGLAKGRKAKIIAISSGGRLGELARKDGVPFIEVPSGYPPRCALGYSFVLPLSVLVKLGLVSNKEAQIREAILTMEGVRRRELTLAKALAGSARDKFCVIYGGQDHIDAVVTRWRGQIAENSKALSSSHIFPEMNHNEIVGWKHPKRLLKDFVVFYLRDTGDHPRVKLRMDITRSIIEKTGAEVIEVRSTGKGLLARIFSLVYVGDLASFYLAILNRTDPTPVESVTYLKKMLAGKRV